MTATASPTLAQPDAGTPLGRGVVRDFIGRAWVAGDGPLLDVHALRGPPHVADLRSVGLVAGIALEPRPDAPGARAADVFRTCRERGLPVRVTGDVVALSPPLIVTRARVDEMLGVLADAIRSVA